jgi:hypothetical protein
MHEMLDLIVENILSYRNSRRIRRGELTMETRMRPAELLSKTELNPVLKPLIPLPGEDVKLLHTRDLPNATTQPFKAWHPLRMKTALRNHPIGRTITIVPLPEKFTS